MLAAAMLQEHFWACWWLMVFIVAARAWTFRKGRR
jgi:hypothetical protein